MKKRWKTLLDGLKSQHRDTQWKIGEWQHEEQIEMCSSGFHCSKTILDAMGYVKPGIVARVEVKGEGHATADKEVWSDMRILQAWQWAKEDAAALAIYAAKLAIGIYEKQYPGDDRPRKAIEAAQRWLKDPSPAAADAAYAAADAAYAAADVAHAADVAAYAAYAAVDAAYAAVDAASAYAHAASAYAHAASAYAHAALKEKVEKWIVRHLKKKEAIS